MNVKFIICLASCLFLNGSFAPIGESKPSGNIDNKIGTYSHRKSVEDSVKDKVAILEDLTRHEAELRLDYHRSKITHDSLVAIAKNIKP